MWQRAKFVRVDDLPQAVGRTVWADIDSVETCRVDKRDHQSGRIISYKISKVIDINVLHPCGDEAKLAPDLKTLELLPEFAENVPMISYDDFLAGKEQ